MNLAAEYRLVKLSDLGCTERISYANQIKDFILSDTTTNASMAKNFFDNHADLDFATFLLFRGEELIPCYMTHGMFGCMMLWVHSVHRLKGYGRIFVEKMDVRTLIPYGAAKPFWSKLGFASRDPEFSYVWAKTLTDIEDYKAKIYGQGS